MYGMLTLMLSVLPAHAEDRLVWTPATMTLDGEEVEGSRMRRNKALHEVLLSCPASAPLERGRVVRMNVGQGLGIGGLLGIAAVTAANPYALGPVLALAGVSFVGDGVMLASISSRKAIAAFNEGCPEPEPEPEPLPMGDDLPEGLDDEAL